MRRIVIVGAGAMGRLHARAVARRAEAAGDCVLEAVVDRNAARSRAVALEFGGAALTSVDELDGSSAHFRPDLAPDLAVVAVPTVSHEAIASRLMRAGFDLLVEKPMTGAAVGAARLVELAASSQRVLAVGHTEWWNPIWARLLSVCGRPRRVSFERRHPATGRGLDIDVIQDFMIHDLDWVRRTVDSEIVECEAEGRCVQGERVDEARARLTFADGTEASFEASRVHDERIRRVEIEGARGRAKGDLITGEIFEASSSAFDDGAADRMEPLDRQLADLLEACRDGRAPVNAGEEAVETLQVVDRVRARVAEGAA